MHFFAVSSIIVESMGHSEDRPATENKILTLREIAWTF